MRGMLLPTREEYNKEYNRRVLPAALISIVGLFLALLTFLFGLRPAVLNGFLEGAESPYAMIEAYDKWYGILAFTQVAAPAIVIVCCVTAVVIGRRTPDAIYADTVIYAVVFCLISLWMCSLMYRGEEDISKLRKMAQEDMAQIADDRLETVEVYLHKKTVREKLPGPYAEGQQESFIVYSGIGEATNHRWERFYIPDILDFTPDAGKLYNEQKSRDWNEENAQLYYITYTTNFRVVTSIQPADS